MGRRGSRTEYEDEPLEPRSTAGRLGYSYPATTSGRARSGCAAIELRQDDTPGFWEGYGYHNYGDPWKEQRYTG